MDSVSTDHRSTEASKPDTALGVAPARMNWFYTWDEGAEIVELYLDHARNDGCLVLCDHREPEENVCTLYWLGTRLKGVVWRGSATARPQNWRDLQYDRVRGYLARG